MTEYLVFTSPMPWPMVSVQHANIHAQYDPFCEVVDDILGFTESRDLFSMNGEDFSPFFVNKSH